MQRGDGSIRMTAPGTRFVTPALGGRHAHPLSRAHLRIRPSSPRAALDAALRDPLGAVRRSARSLAIPSAMPWPTRATLRAATPRWTSTRRISHESRSWRAHSRTP